MKVEYFVLIFLIVSIFGFYYYETHSNKNTQVTENVVKNKISINTTNDPYIKPTTSDQHIIRGKNIVQRHKLVVDSLGAQNSGTIMKVHFPDIQVVFVDNEGKDAPYHYFYSQEGYATFVFNKNAISVAVCEGKVDQKITTSLMEKTHCVVKDY